MTSDEPQRPFGKPALPLGRLLTHASCFAAGVFGGTSETHMWDVVGALMLALAVIGGGVALVGPSRDIGVQMLRLGRTTFFGWLAGTLWREWSSML